MKKKSERKPKTTKFLQKRVLVGLALIGVIGVVGLVVYLRRPAKTPEITNFQECVQAGYPVMESYPRQCRIVKGEIFVERVEGEEGLEGQEGICVDFCGDGICQEVVCLGEGCPCAETPESCPEDCP